ncbi:hypothetical protein LDO98_14625, partial [Paenarthrobacter aurescens]|uniref:hypothetical protein n=1 Tax=Paenarthrobacter aurescens TaxID=43663 RepID=UPI0026E1EEE1
ARRTTPSPAAHPYAPSAPEVTGAIGGNGSDTPSYADQRIRVSQERTTAAAHPFTPGAPLLHPQRTPSRHPHQR